jgi:hypothetical protein
MENEWEVFGEPDNDDYAAWSRLSRKAGIRSGGSRSDAAAKPPRKTQRLVLMEKAGRSVEASQHISDADRSEAARTELA